MLMLGKHEDCQRSLDGAVDFLVQVGLEDNFYFQQVLDIRREQLRRVQHSIGCFTATSRLLADRPGISNSSFTLVCGEFSEETLHRAKAASPSSGWRLSSDPVFQKLRMYRNANMFCSIVFCAHMGVKFSWAMLLTSLRQGLEQCHLLLSDNRALCLDAAVMQTLSQLRIVSLDLSSCNLVGSLSRHISLLESLQHLDLRSNQLTQLPLCLGGMSLKSLDVRNNSTFIVPPQVVVDQGRGKVLKHLHKLALHGRPYNRGQLVVIGTDGAQECVLRALLSGGGIEDRSFACSIGLHEWNPPGDPKSSFKVLAMDSTEVLLWKALLSTTNPNHMTFLLAHRVPRDNAKKRAATAAVRSALNNLYLLAPGISVLLIAVLDVTEASEHLGSVKAAVTQCVNSQQHDIEVYMKTGRHCSAKPIRLVEHGESHVLNVKSGHGAETLRRKVLSLAQHGTGYGETIPRSWHEVLEKIINVRSHQALMSWQRFRALCDGVGASSSSSKICHALEGNAIMAKIRRAVQPHSVSGARALASSDLSSAFHQMHHEDLEQYLVIKNFVSVTKMRASVCCLQSALRRVDDEYRYLKRLRRKLKIEALQEQIQVAIFLQGAGEIYFPSLSLCVEIMTLQMRKSRIIDELNELRLSRKFLHGQQRKHTLHLSKAALLHVDHEQSSLLKDLCMLKATLARLTKVNGEGSNWASLVIKPRWLVCILRALSSDNMNQLAAYLKSEEKMSVHHDLEVLFTTGIASRALLAFLWPCTSAESKQYWQLTRKSAHGEGMWPTDFKPLNLAIQDDLTSLLSLLEDLKLARQITDESYVLQVASAAMRPSRKRLPSSAYCDERCSFRVHLVYSDVPVGFFSNLIYFARKTHTHVEYTTSPFLATLHKRGSKALICLLNVKDPACVLPSDMQDGHRLSTNNVKSAEIERALLKKISDLGDGPEKIEAAIDKMFRSFQKSADDDLGGLELDRSQFFIPISPHLREWVFCCAATDA